MEKLKKKYFDQRIKSLEKEKFRSNLANREIETYKILENICKKKFLIKNGSVCDIGCGDQYLKSEFIKNNMSYIGYDINEINIECDKIPLKNNSTNLMLCLAVIEHISDPSNLFSEAYRCLEKNGVFIVETPNWQYCYKNFYDDYTHVKPYTVNSLRKLFFDFGFTDIYDFPNLRCKNNFFYTNKFKYFIASKLPFLGLTSRIVPKILKGRSTGMYVIGLKT